MNFGWTFGSAWVERPEPWSQWRASRRWKDWWWVLTSPTRGWRCRPRLIGLGVGWGVTGGVCLIVVTGVHQPSQLNGFQTGGKDFTLALEEKWDSIAKAAG